MLLIFDGKASTGNKVFFFQFEENVADLRKKITDFKGNATDLAFDTVLFPGTCNADLNFEEFFSYFKDNAIGCVYLILTIDIIISKQLSNF